MLEHYSAPVLSRCAFFIRMAGVIGIALTVTALSLFAGMAGYHYLEGLPWLDSFLNAAMILGGMGEIDIVKTEAGKLFAGFYALYSGLWLVASMGILLGPVLHRVLHKLHVREK